MFLPGIYRIQNTINGNSYIGSAVVVQKRWNVHNHGLRNNKHPNTHLQRAYNKYGENSFKWYVLELVRDENNLIEREQYYIDELNPEYNLCKIAGSRLGMRHTDEVKVKCAEAARNQVRTKESRLKQSRTIAANGGSHFKGRSHTKEVKKKLSDANKGLHNGEKNAFYGKKHTAESIKKMSTPIIQYTKDGSFIKEWLSSTEAAKSFKKNRGNIASCVTGKSATAYNFIWKYKELNTNTNIN